MYVNLFRKRFIKKLFGKKVYQKVFLEEEFIKNTWQDLFE